MDLSLVPIEEIQDELDRRFDNVVLLTNKIRNKHDVYEFHLFGGELTAIGMCQLYIYGLTHKKELEEIDGFSQD